MPLFIAILMYAIWSLVFPLAKMTLQHGPPLLLTALRMLLAATLLLSLLKIRKENFIFTKRQLIACVFYGLLGMYLTNACEYWSLCSLSAAKSCFFYSLSPFLAALLSFIHFKEKMNSRKWMGMGIGFLGIIPVLLSQTNSENAVQGISFLSWGDLAALGAVFFSTYGWVLLRLLVKGEEPLSPALSNSMGMLIGGGYALVHSFFVESWAPLPFSSAHWGAFIGGMLLLTLISNMICMNLYGWALKRLTATSLSFIGLLSPFFASAYSWMLLGETPSPIIFLSTGILGLGLWLVYSAELKQGYITSSPALSTEKT